MFDSAAFNVVLGLILIYLLYSLLATILGEMIATWLGIRARILRIGIERMLNDGYYRKKSLQKLTGSNPPTVPGSIQDRIKAFFGAMGNYLRSLFTRFRYIFLMLTPREFANSFAGRFYEYPSIKYLTRLESDQRGPFGSSKPSYISAENFAETLINMLQEKGTGNTPLEKIIFCLQFNTLKIQPETSRHLNDLLQGANNDVPKFHIALQKWFNETMDRANGWYKRKMQFILIGLGFIMAVTFNIDSITISRILSKDKAANEQFANMAVAISKDTSRYHALINDKGDTGFTREVLDTGLARVTKDIHDANLILGLGWQGDTLYNIRDVVLNKKEDSIAYAIATAHIIRIDSLAAWIHRQQDSVIPGTLLKLNNSIQAAQNQYRALMVDSAQHDNTQTSVAQFNLMQSAIKSYQQILSLDSAALKDSLKAIQKVNASTVSLAKNQLTIIDTITIDNNGIMLHGRKPFSKFQQFWYVIWDHPHSWIRLLGFLITALAISLGAPFWFDLLAKLVVIRNAGVKPEEKKKKATDPNTEPLPGGPLGPFLAAPLAPPVQQPKRIALDSIDEAIQQYASDIMKLPGVKGVLKGSSKSTNGTITQFLQVNVADSAAGQLVLNNFPSLQVSIGTVIPTIVVTGTPTTHNGNTGTITNDSSMNGFGSLGCVVRENRSNIFHMLSCWHVLKGNPNYDQGDTYTDINEAGLRKIAQRWTGGIQDTYDFGLAEYHPGKVSNFNTILRQQLNVSNNAPLLHRKVLSSDVNKKIGIRFYDAVSTNQIVDGIIYSEMDELEISYSDKTRIVKNVLLLTKSLNNQTTISQGGNSGSIVFDSNNNAIAMIIGGDNLYTYAVHLSDIMDIFKNLNIA